MARVTECCCPGEPFGVAIVACRRLMRASQWEIRRVVIDLGGFPGRCRVTFGACGRETRGDVIGIRRTGIITLVTGHALCGGSCIPGRVATCARHRCMRAGQRKIC